MTDDAAHSSIRLGLGAYVLGGLEPAERAELEQHLRGCASCREELATFAAVPALLSRLPAGGIEEAPRPSAGLLPALLTAAARQTTRRVRRWQATALTAVAAAIVAVVITVSTVPAQPHQSTPITLAATSGTAAGSVSLQERPWGTAISLDVTGLPPQIICRAWAVGSDGRREPAATWSSTEGGRAVVDGATSIPRSELLRLEVVTSSGTVLLSAAG